MSGAIAASVSATGAADAEGAAAPPPLRCTLSAPATGVTGRPLPLRLTLHNTGRQPLRILVWGTPFEGWMAPFVSVQRDGVALDYRGAMVKRGAPGPDEYLAIAPGRSRRATVDLAEAFDLGQPGRYRVTPRLQLHGWATGRASPAAPAAQPGVALDCNAVDTTLRPPRP